MKRQYKVTLTDEERQQLQEMVGKGKSNAPKIKHANILLACDESEGVKRFDVEVAQLFHCHAKTVYNIRERFVEQGLEAALERKKRETPPTPPIFDGRAEAQLIAVACSSPPEGRSRWTMQLLADHCVELNIVEHCSDETVRKILKKTNLSRTLKSVG